MWVGRLPLAFQSKGAVGIIVEPQEINGFLVLTEEDQFYRLQFRGAASGRHAIKGKAMGNHLVLIVDGRVQHLRLGFGGMPLGMFQNQCKTIVCCAFVVLWCRALWWCVVMCCVVWCCAVWCGVVWCSVARYCVALCCVAYCVVIFRVRMCCMLCVVSYNVWYCMCSVVACCDLFRAVVLRCGTLCCVVLCCVVRCCVVL